MAGTNLFAPSEGLDAAQPVAGSNLFADPNAPGPFKRGLKAGVAGLKGSAAGAMALVGDTLGVESMKTAGLAAAKSAAQDAAAVAMPVENVDSLGSAVDFAKYGAGYLVPNLASSLTAGVLGRLGGGALARGVADPAAGLLARNAGMTAALAASSIAQEAGGIYPDAVEAGLPDAAARAVIGGTLAGGLDLVPELLAGRMLGVFGSKVANPGRALSDILIRGAKGAAVGATVEGGTEGVQAAIARQAAGKELTGPEAISDYANSVALGVVGGTVVGGPVGALGAIGGSTAPTVAPVEPVAAPALPPAAAPAEPIPAAETPVESAFRAFKPEDLRTIYSADSLRIVDTSETPRKVVLADELSAVQTQLDALNIGPQSAPEIIAQAKALTERAGFLQAELATPEPAEKTSLTQPIIIGGEPAVAAPAKPLISLKDEERLQLAEREATAVARRGNFTDDATPGIDLDTQLGLIKRQQGVLLSDVEAKGVREFEKAATPLVVEGRNNSRGVSRVFDDQTRKENFANAYSSGVDTLVQQLEQSGAMKARTLSTVSTILKRGVELAIQQPTPEQATTVFNAAFDKAMKGKILKQDVETFRQKLADHIASNLPREAGVPGDTALRSNVPERMGAPTTGEQQTLFSKAAFSLPAAIMEARSAGRGYVFDPRTSTTISLGHPVFDSAQAYNAANGMPPIQEVEYAPVNPEQGAKIAAAYERLQKVNPSPETQAAYAALAKETEQQFEAAAAAIKIEPWRQEGQPYKNSAEMRKDVFENQHLWVFEGGEVHPYMTPEQNWKFRAVHDLYGHAKTGFEFGVRGELNATRAHMQMYSNAAIPAMITETLGQNMWVNFNAANADKAPADKPYADQKADLLPETAWRPLVEDVFSTRTAVAARRNEVASAKGQAVLKYLEQVLGTPAGLEVGVVERLEGGAGKTTLTKAKAVISVSLQSQDVLSVAAHEGFHYLENRVLSAQDRVAVQRAFEYGSPLHTKLVEKARSYDRLNGTQLEAEILAVPAEARAYGFEFWRRGELDARGPVAKAFAALKRVMERITNFISGQGFTSYSDVFEAVERGDYATRQLSALKTFEADQSYLDSIEPDALPEVQVLNRNKSASTAKGRPSWVQSASDVRKLRGLLKALANEGVQARNWYRRSSAAIMAWSGGDQAKAAKLAALVAMYSPRTPVGEDLRKAIQHYEQWAAGQKINAGGTRHQAAYGTEILEGRGHRDYLDKYSLPGNPESAPKVNSFFKNMMFQIDPVSYPRETQDATIDMWMSHIFGFGAMDGKLSDANYWWADAEIKKLSREAGYDPDQVQATIWVAIKARGNTSRAAARKEGIANGWFTADVVQENRTDDLFGGGGGRAKYTLKKQYESDYMVNWIRLALSVPFSQADFDKANYSYAEAFRDIADGTVELNRLDDRPEFAAGLFNDIAFGKYTDGEISFFSKAATLADVAQRVQAGEAPRSQLNSMWASMVDDPTVPDGLREEYLRPAVSELKGVAGSLKRALTQVQSGHNIARKSVGFKNVFNALTSYTQRKNRLIADAVERQLSSWVTGNQIDKQAASRALLERTEKSLTTSSPEYQLIRRRLNEQQRVMFDQATSMIANSLDAELKADAAVYRSLFTDDQQYAEWYAERSAQVERLKAEGYMPERRYGDHVVYAYAEGDNKKVTAYYSQHEREADARNELAELKRLLPDQGLKFEYGYRYKADYDGSISFAQFVDTANRHGIQLTQGEKERVGKALIAADSTRRNRVFRRKNVAGYSEDGMRVLAEFGVSMANKIAYAELGGSIQDALLGKEQQISFTPSGDVQVNSYENNLWEADGEQGGFYRNIADQTTDFVMSPRQGSKVSSGLRLAASAQFLGGSAAAAIVQLTSLPMNTIPWLTQHTSYTDALAKVYAGTVLAAKHLNTIKDLPKLLDANVRMEGIDNVDGLRRALQIAAQDGTILDTEIYQIMGLSRGQEYSLSGKVQKGVRIWMAPFRLTENLNRVSTFVAAYNVAKSKGLDNEAAYKLAQDTVHSTQFRYDEANRPALARGDVGSLLFTFKTYPIFMLETMSFLAKENPRAAAYMMMSLVAMAGLEGLPFAEDIEDLIDTIAQRIFGSPFNTKRALRNTLKAASEAVVGADLSSVFMHGVANELTELAFASRVGMGNLIPGTRIGAADADYKRVVGEILGPIGSLVTGVLGGADSLSKGQFTEAARQALPLAGQNLIKGWQQFEKGFATDIGGRKLIDVGGMEAFWQALGFSSSALSEAYETDKIDKQTSAFYAQAKQGFQRDLSKAIRDNKPEDVADVTRALIAWNAVHPEMPIAISSASMRRQIQLANMPLNQRTMATLPKALRSSSESALGLQED